MSAFAIVLLSQTMFGGAQKRFFNLHRHFRSTYGENAWFIVSPAMKAEIEKTYGHEYCQGIHAIGEPVVATSALSATKSVVTKPRNGLINSLKSSIAFLDNLESTSNTTYPISSLVFKYWPTMLILFLEYLNYFKIAI